jgi:two-component system chemotaxis response regulator CheB
MAGHDIIVLGASAGGVEALASLVKDLPARLPAALFVVCHFPPGQRSILPEILSRSGPLPAAHAQDGEVIYKMLVQRPMPPNQRVPEAGIEGAGSAG